MLTQSTTVHRIAVLIVIGSVLMGGCAAGPGSAQTSARPQAPEVRATGEVAAKVAVDQVGTPYRYGGASGSGFDCSGLVHYAYRQAGKDVPRTTGGLWRQSKPVAVADLRAGDILFFNIDGKMSHVGLYLGGGQFVHAPSTGKQVTTAGLDAAFYRQALIRGGRF